jgi:hypothetical protein
MFAKYIERGKHAQNAVQCILNENHVPAKVVHATLLMVLSNCFTLHGLLSYFAVEQILAGLFFAHFKAIALKPVDIEQESSVTLERSISWVNRKSCRPQVVQMSFWAVVTYEQMSTVERL